MGKNIAGPVLAITASLVELAALQDISRATAYRVWLSDPTFPRPLTDGGRSRRWSLRQFVDWVNARGHGGAMTFEDASAAVNSIRASVAKSRKRTH